LAAALKALDRLVVSPIALMPFSVNLIVVMKVAMEMLLWFGGMDVEFAYESISIDAIA
jgi:hypothetical protein